MKNKNFIFEFLVCCFKRLDQILDSAHMDIGIIGVCVDEKTEYMETVHINKHKFFD